MQLSAVGSIQHDISDLLFHTAPFERLPAARGVYNERIMQCNKQTRERGSMQRTVCLALQGFKNNDTSPRQVSEPWWIDRCISDASALSRRRSGLAVVCTDSFINNSLHSQGAVQHSRILLMHVGRGGQDGTAWSTEAQNVSQ